MNGEHVTWEYRTEPELASAELDQLGDGGWELVSVDNRMMYFKRARPPFRERVTLEQRARYFSDVEGAARTTEAAS